MDSDIFDDSSGAGAFDTALISSSCDGRAPEEVAHLSAPYDRRFPEEVSSLSASYEGCVPEEVAHVSAPFDPRPPSLKKIPPSAGSPITAEDSLPPAHVLDKRYRILKAIKTGGMGAVYQAEDLKLNGKIVAIKQMLDTFSTPTDRQQGIDRFLSEVQILATLRHPNIPRVTDHFMEEKSFYFVMDYIEGIDLSTLLRREGAPGLAEERVLEYCIQVCDALIYLHGLNPPVVHRDIKPSNLIYRCKDGRILIIDFGIARVTNPQEGFWIGTPGYAPPEQIWGRPEPRSDLYALGASLHELITGKRPNPESFEFAGFEELGVKASKKIEELLAPTLALNPEERIPSARRLRDLLVEILGREPQCIGAPEEFQFTVAVQNAKDHYIDPLLKDLMSRYVNECYTRFLPKNLEYLTFTLACPTEFELIVRRNDDDRCIEFFEKQGILDMKLLGRVDPCSQGELQRIRDIIDRFSYDYDLFKNSSEMNLF
jgi:serine/threonine protein kinase